MAEKVNLPSEAFKSYVSTYQPPEIDRYSPGTVSPELINLGKMAQNGLLKDSPRLDYVSTGETDDIINKAGDTTSKKSEILDNMSIIYEDPLTQFGALIGKKMGRYAERPDVANKIKTLHPYYRGLHILSDLGDWKSSYTDYPGKPGEKWSTEIDMTGRPRTPEDPKDIESRKWVNFVQGNLDGKPIDRNAIKQGWVDIVDAYQNLDKYMDQYTSRGEGDFSPKYSFELLNELSNDRGRQAIQKQAAMAMAGMKTPEAVKYLDQLALSWKKEQYFKPPEEHEDLVVYLSKLPKSVWTITKRDTSKSRPITSWGI